MYYENARSLAAKLKNNYKMLPMYYFFSKSKNII